MELDLNIPFSKGLSDPIRASIATAIWGEDEKSDERLERLMLFFEYYRRETMTVSLSVPKSSGLAPIQTHGELNQVHLPVEGKPPDSEAGTQNPSPERDRQEKLICFD